MTVPRAFRKHVRGWSSASAITPRDYHCGFCDNQAGSDRGFSSTDRPESLIYKCPRCGRPTFFETIGGQRYPGSKPGSAIGNCPPELAALYDEAREATGGGAYTAAVMVCRKMLMNIAVREGAKEGLTFVKYIEHLESEGFFSPKAKKFVNYIRELGNEANHAIQPRSEADAMAVIEFVGALLRHNYDLPAKVPVPNKASDLLIGSS